jgi:hypothetical protein
VRAQVAYDYAQRVAAAANGAEYVIASALGGLTGYSASNFVTCPLTNVTLCSVLEAGGQIAVTVYNSQAVPRANVPVRVSAGFPSGVASYAVYDATGAAAVAQVLPLSAADTQLRGIYNGSAVLVQWLTWIAPTLPALGYTTFFLLPAASVAEAPLTHISKPQRLVMGRGGLRHAANGVTVGDTPLTTGSITVTIAAATGLVAGYTNAATGVSVPLLQTLLWYNSSTGNQEDGQASGAYIFRPNSSDPFPVASGVVTVDIITGPIVQEARQTFSPWASQVVRLWRNATYAEFQWSVGHIPTDMGHEVIARYTTPLATNATW